MFSLVDISPSHDPSLRSIIQACGVEFNAVGDGFGPSDEEVNAISQNYGVGKTNARSRYFVAIDDATGEVQGGGGYSLFDAETKTCEFRKFYLKPDVRRNGVGRALAQRCLDAAKEEGYEICYLDTIKAMKPAIALYLSMGFIHLEACLGNSTHHGCDVWMTKEL